MSAVTTPKSWLYFQGNCHRTLYPAIRTFQYRGISMSTSKVISLSMPRSAAAFQLILLGLQARGIESKAEKKLVKNDSLTLQALNFEHEISYASLIMYIQTFIKGSVKSSPKIIVRLAERSLLMFQTSQKKWVALFSIFPNFLISGQGT